MSPRTLFILMAVALVSMPFLAHGSNRFLEAESMAFNKVAFKDDIINAIGCGGGDSAQAVASIRMALEPMWRTLPKTSDRIDRRSLRYLVHRYFMQTSSLMIRGFEPTRSVNESHWGVADILSQMVPAYVESVLESSHVTKYGFSLNDAINMVVMLEQLIFDAESSLLEKAYRMHGQSTDRSISQEALKQILESYMVEWMVAADEEDMEMLRANRSLTVEIVPHFELLVEFADGRMKALHFARLQKIPKGNAKDTFDNKFSFGDAHKIVGGITQKFQTFWQSECESMKSALVSMDTHNTGRVPLAKFYNTAMNTDWRFGESESYLRELGALDESSSLAGPQVLVSNYVQATSNCIVSTPHYLVCCHNECESILGDIEAAVRTPTATPADILAVVGNMTLQTSIDDEDAPRLEGALTKQLEQIASLQAGVVPLHGRLFAQWLHYVFPTECSFPHKIGMVSAVTPQQYGDEYVASESDMRKHASNATRASINITINKGELHWMSQWSSEEELIVDYSSELGMPWERRMLLALAGVVLLVFGITGGAVGCNAKTAAYNKKCWV